MLNQVSSVLYCHQGPGLSFEDQVAVVGSDPNRADIALFVGFVARRQGAALPGAVRDWLIAQGWERACRKRPPAYALDNLLNVPVPIDNWQVFDYLFDWQPPLSPDGLSGGTTLLSAAVRSFFSQGGRKCYCVRAGEPLPSGLLPADRQGFIDTWVDLLIPGYPGEFEGSSADPAGWRGLAHLYGLPDVAYLSLPDLPLIVRAPAAEISPAVLPVQPLQQFVECSQGEEAVFVDEINSANSAPRCDEAGYAAWARAVSLAAQVLSDSRREVQLVAGVPIPQAGQAHEADLLGALLDEGRGPLSGQPQLQRDGIASAFVQLAYPWLRTGGSQHLPEGLENPEGVLAGVLARNALGRGAFFSAAGLDLGDVYDISPLLAPAQMFNSLPVVSADLPGRRSRNASIQIERVSLFGPTPGGLRLLSDVTTSPAESYRPASINRLVAVILRAARRLGEEVTFEASAERLWGQVRDSLNGLMLNLLQLGALRGANPAQAFSVRCDRSTMTQNDIDAGRVIAEIQFDAAAPVERISVVLALNEGGQVSLVSSSPELAPLQTVVPAPESVLEVSGTDPLSNPVSLNGADRLLSVAFDGAPQLIALPTSPLTPIEMAAAVNAGLHWGYARLSGTRPGEPAGRLVIGSINPKDYSLSTVSSTLSVEANPGLGFPARIQVKAG